MYVTETLQVVVLSPCVLRVIESMLNVESFLVVCRDARYSVTDTSVSHATARLILLHFRQCSTSFRIRSFGTFYLIDPAVPLKPCHRRQRWRTVTAQPVIPRMSRLLPEPKPLRRPLTIAIPQEFAERGTLLMRSEHCAFEYDPRYTA